MNETPLPGTCREGAFCFARVRADIFDGGMPDRLPLDAHQQRGEGNRNIGEHKQREEGQIHHLFQRRGGNAPPLGEDGEQAVEKHHAIAPQQHGQQGTADMAEHEIGQKRRQGEDCYAAEEVDENRRDGQQHAGGDGH